MTLALDLPDCPPSIVSRLDPRWKLAAVLLATVAIALIRSEGPAGVAFFGSLVLVVLARLPFGWYARRLGTALVLFLFFLIWLPLVHQENDAPLDFGVITLSLTGTLRLFVLTAKLTAMVSLMLVLSATAPLHETFKAAHSLKIPGLLVQLVLLTYRYVHLLIEEFHRLRIALRVRGFRSGVNLHSYHTIGQVAGTLLVRSHERSERVSAAMCCRGFDGEYRSLSNFQTHAIDVLAFFLMVGIAVGLVAWDWWLRSS